MARFNIDTDFKSSRDLERMSNEEKVIYFNQLREFALSLSYDEEEVEKQEERFKKTVDFVIPKFIKHFEPNISIKNPNLPKQFILVSNHLDSFDQFALSAAFPEHVFHYMIAESLMTAKNLWVGKLYVKVGSYVIDRSSTLGKKMAIPQSLQFLLRGKKIAMFPEGSRKIRYGSDGTVQQLKPGAIEIAQIAGIPIVPATINNNFKKRELFINVGEEFKVREEDSIIKKTQELRETLIDLWQENKDKGAVILTKRK